MKVWDVSLACDQLNRLVRMNGGFLIGGDSGGGWSYGNTAYGAPFGSCDGLDSWSLADLFDEALGIWVATADSTK
jgi:streptogrisin C